MKRNAEHMATVLQELVRVWQKYPEQRLCQLIVNVTKKDDPFYVEDKELLTRLSEYK